jgi:hypothetical protein
MGQHAGTYDQLAGVCTDIAYDALGRKSFVSYAYEGSKTTSDRSVVSLSQAHPGTQPTNPEPPCNIQSTAGEDYIELTWDCASSDVLFEIQQTKPLYPPITRTQVGQHNYRFNSLDGCYAFKMRSVGADQPLEPDPRYVSTWVHTAQICTIHDTENPPEPGSFEATAGATYVDLSWVENTVSDLKGYYIECQKADSFQPWNQVVMSDNQISRSCCLTKRCYQKKGLSTKDFST